MYASKGPEKEKLRGVISQAPLLKLVKPPARPVFYLASIFSKIIPNFKIYSPIPVLAPLCQSEHREMKSPDTQSVQRNMTRTPLSMEPGHCSVYIQCLLEGKSYSTILLSSPCLS